MEPATQFARQITQIPHQPRGGALLHLPTLPAFKKSKQNMENPLDVNGKSALDASIASDSLQSV